MVRLYLSRWYLCTDIRGFGGVVGLIAALGNLTDIDKLGASIAAAFVATLLGIFTGYVIWLPFANKLKMLSKLEVTEKE